jgi:hypothetical protein
MPDASYELTLEPAENGMGWTAMIYRTVRAGICGPFTDTVTVPAENPYAMFHPVTDLAAAALAALRMAGEFTPGPPEVYGRYGAIALRVPLTRIDRPHLLPQITAGGGLEWVQA